MKQDILDRIASALRERQGVISAQEIAADHLRLSSAGSAAADTLVRAILSKDSRFEEGTPGVWSLAKSRDMLRPPVVLCRLEVPPAAQRAPWLWRVSASLWGSGDGRIVSHEGQAPTQELDTIWRWLAEHPAACDRPGLLSRWMGARERLHAMPEVDQPLIDLSAWGKIAQARAGIHDTATMSPGEAGVESSAPRENPLEGIQPEEQFKRIAGRLEQVLQIAGSRGLTTWSEIALLPDIIRQEAADRVWNEAWSFTPDEIQGLPEEPGIYRFTGEADRLLYVGKAKNLRTRVASYFRPLEETSSRRAAFLSEIRGLEFETTGTELEALILEARVIREEEPGWNTQLQIHRDEACPPQIDEDMLLLLPTVSAGFRLFAFSGNRLAIGAVTSLQADEICRALRTFFVEGDSLPELHEVDGPERTLARRWLRRGWQGSTVLRLTDFATYAAVAEEVQRICGADVAEDAAGPANIVRGAASRPSHAG